MASRPSFESMPEELREAHIGPHAPKIEGDQLVSSGPVGSPLGREKYKSKPPIERIPKYLTPEQRKATKEFVDGLANWMKPAMIELLMKIPDEQRRLEFIGKVGDLHDLLDTKNPKTEYNHLIQELDASIEADNEKKEVVH